MEGIIKRIDESKEGRKEASKEGRHKVKKKTK